jgi:hypothetical protein
MICSEADCRAALTSILKKEKPSLRDARLLMKAIEESGTPFVDSQAQRDPVDIAKAKARRMGEKIRTTFPRA